ncbi:MAG: acyl-CoA thioesterase [Hyphomicrobiales bacterium]
MRMTAEPLRQLAAAIIVLGAMAVSEGAEAQIVAFGASNVAGFGVAPGEAFPAQLERMLKAKGYDASVANAGINGDTSSGMLSRLDAAIPSGTTVVLLDTSGPIANNPHQGIGRTQGQADMAAITARLGARRITIIPETANVISRRYRQEDGRHLTAEGHRLLAQRLLPQVMRALGPPPSR